MAALCQHFVQNAWKKDLCSNCFKSKEEHEQHGVGTTKSRYLATMYPSRAHSWRQTPQGILKDGQQVRRSKGSAAVHFPTEESHVIGFGGDECFSSDGEDAPESGVPSDEDSGEGEEDRALQKLTRNNTDFNMVTANLSGESDTKKTYTQLMLGKPLTDAEGRRKTLLVSVTPFGGQEGSDTSTITNGRKSHLTKLLHEPQKKIITQSSFVKYSELPNEKTGDIILKSIIKNEKESLSSETEISTKRINSFTHQNSRDILFKSLVKPSSTAEDQPDSKSCDISLKLVTVKTSYKPSRETIDSTSKPSESRIPVSKGRVLPAANRIAGRSDQISKSEDNLPKPAIRKTYDSVKKPETAVKKANLIVKPEEDDRSEADQSPSDVVMNPIETMETTSTEISSEEISRKASDDEMLPVRKIEGESTNKEKESVESEVTMDILLKEKDMFCVEESRELAGEPDGRADPDELTEPPALPRSPPPVADPRPSFLHALTQVRGDKPKIPVKPNTKLLQATPRRNFITHPPKEDPEQELQHESETSAVECEVTEPSAALDSAKAHKRQAPKPPPVPIDDVPCPLFTRNPSIGLINSSSPVTREKEKRERASSCTPKILAEEVAELPAPEPAPRRSLSLSAESLPSAVPVSTPCDLDKKKSTQGRARFSLRKFLRFGSSKEDKCPSSGEVQRPEDVGPSLPAPRPRLEIIHPLELNGSNVEVVRGDASNVRSSSSSSNLYENSKENELLSDSGNVTNPALSGRPTKPPPPPRNQSLDAWGKVTEGQNKPARPPPPKSAELLRQQKQPTGHIQPSSGTVSNLYANLGEVRSGLTPSKPQRTSSIRDANVDGPKRRASPKLDDGGYESVELADGKNVPDVTENLYECVTPVHNSADSRPDRLMQQRRSEGSVDALPDYLKFRGSFTRSTSLPYCSSETESDIYSPYSFYGSEDAGDDDMEWPHPWKTSKLRLRKGRSVVHKNLEDNYGAVVVANHEALAQVLEQVNIGAVVQPALRGLKTTANLRWSDFTLLDDSHGMTVGKRTFHPALWGVHAVTLSVAVDQSNIPSRGCFTLCPITEFSDLVPVQYLANQSRDNTQHVQACVVVLPRMQVDTIQTYGTTLRSRLLEEEQWRDGSFILLQFVNGLKTLQAQGIEETSLSSFALCCEERDPHPRLCILQGLAREAGSLCQCALEATRELLSGAPLAPLITDLLRQERAVSLSQVKSVLEFSLWGPADVALGAPSTERELVLQRWLDLERATVLHGLVRTRVELTVFEECHLLFLVRTSAKIMCEASMLMDSNSPEITNF